MNTNSIHYPRNILIRRLLRALGRLLIPLLAHVTINGKENFPKSGPLILAGNHVAIVEVLLMIIYAPYITEIIGTGDIPLDPSYAWLAKMYGYIPMNRGNIDQQGLKQALSVLQQGGVLAIFPEGGIWQPAAMQAHTGVSYLSSQGNAPVLPIGFGGMRGALAGMLRFKHPQMSMTIGELLPPVQVNRPDLSRKEALVQGANEILERIRALVPVEERRKAALGRGERYELGLQLLDGQGRALALPPEPAILQAIPLAKFLCQPVLLDVFVRNLHMAQVRPLEYPHPAHPAGEIEQAAQAVLSYLETNPGFLTYRFGVEEGIEMRAGIAQLRDLAHWAAGQGYAIDILPKHIYKDERGNNVVENGGKPMHSM